MFTAQEEEEEVISDRTQEERFYQRDFIGNNVYNVNYSNVSIFPAGTTVGGSEGWTGYLIDPTKF